MNTLNYLFQLFVVTLCILLLNACESIKRVDVKKENIGSAELAYYTRGSGEPLVMIIGYRGTMAAWDPGLLEILEKKFTLILFDNRGTGLSSDLDKETLTISQMAEDTAQLIKKLGYQKAHVLGWSMGSRIAMELSVKHPEITESLILCSPNPGGNHQAARTSNAHAELTSPDISQKEALSLIFPETPEGKRASASFVNRLTKAVMNGTVPDDSQVSQQTINRQIQALKLWDENNQIFKDLLSIKTPTLIAGGVDDVVDNSENITIVANQIPFAWTAYFAGAGHAFLSQDYKNFAELVILFIESNKKVTK